MAGIFEDIGLANDYIVAFETRRSRRALVTVRVDESFASLLLVVAAGSSGGYLLPNPIDFGVESRVKRGDATATSAAVVHLRERGLHRVQHAKGCSGGKLLVERQQRRRRRGDAAAAAAGGGDRGNALEKKLKTRS